MKIPKEFEDVFRGVDLTEGEIRTLTWIAGWESRTVKNLRSAIQKAQDAALTALRPVSREPLEKFKEYFDDLYGKGLEVYGWHMNGEAKSFDDFYEDACEYAGL